MVQRSTASVEQGRLSDVPTQLPDDLLEHIVGGAGPVSPLMVAALLRRAGFPVEGASVP